MCFKNIFQLCRVNRKEMNDDTIFFRISKEKKESWKKICVQKNISMTSLIIHSVDNKIQDNERKDVLKFIENQDNIFVKVETNINQIARIVNGQKFIDQKRFVYYTELLKEVVKLKEEQNKMFAAIYHFLAK